MSLISIPLSTQMAEFGVTGWAERMQADNVGFMLMQVPPQNGIDFSSSSTTNLITLATAQTWQTGTRFQFVDENLLGGPSIAPYSTGVDYFLIRVTSTTFRLALTRANALINTFETLPDIPNSEFSLTISEPSVDWDIEELVFYEISHPLYTARYSIPVTLPAPVTSGTDVYIDFLLTDLTNTDPATFTYNAIAVLQNPGAIGNTAGVTVVNAGRLNDSFGAASARVIAQGQQKSITYRLGIGTA